MGDKSNILKALFVSNAFFVFAETMLIPLYAIFVKDLGASILIISWLAATVFLVNIIGMLVLRYLGDSMFTPSELLVAGFVLRAVAWATLIFATTIPALFVIQAIIGLGQAIGSPGFLALFAKYVKEQTGIRSSADWGIIAAVTGARDTVA